MYNALENALIELANRTKGTVDFSLLLATLDQAGILKIENVPLSSTAFTRASNANREVSTLRAHNLLPTFDSLQNIPTANTEEKGNVMECIESKLEETPELRIPDAIQSRLEQCGVSYELLVEAWFHEDATKRRVFRLRILKYIGAFAFRVAQGWVHCPPALFRSFVFRGHPLNKQSPEEVQARKAEKARQAVTEGNDAQRMKETALRDAESVQANPQSLTLDKSLLEMLKTYHKRHGKLEQMHLSMLKSAGVQDWQKAIGA